MTCHRCQERLSPHLDGVLSREEEQKVCAHLAQCADCSQRLSQLATNRHLIRALPEAEVTRAMEARFLSRVQSLESKAYPEHSRRIQIPKATVHSSHSLLLTPYSLLLTWWRNFPILSYGTVATCAASLLFYFAMMQAPPKVSAEEVVASMDQLIGTLDPDEGERALTEESADEAMPNWSDEIDGELFENENEQD